MNMFNKILTVFAVFVITEVSPACSINITIGLLLERSVTADFPFSINRTRGLISVAINYTMEVMADIADMEFIIVPVDVRTCTAMDWGAAFAQMYCKHKPHVLIGPGCSVSVEPVARMAASWNIPHITYSGSDELLGNKQVFSTLTRSGLTVNAHTHLYFQLLEEFGWTYVAIIYDESKIVHNMMGRNLQDSFRENAPHIQFYAVPFNSDDAVLNYELHRAFTAAVTEARVFLIFCHGDVLREMVVVAQNSDLKEGEYVFIYMFEGHGSASFGDYTWYREQSDVNQEVKKGYHSVFVIRPRKPTNQEFIEFEEEIKRGAYTEYNYTWKEGHEVMLYTYGMYDSFIIYTQALSEILAANADPRDGKAVVRQMWNKTFPGIGGPFYINSNGDRVVDYSILDLDPKTGEFQIVCQFLGWKGVLEYIPNVSIHWPGSGLPPENMPVCGFTGDLCLSFHLSDSAVLAICLSCAIVVVVVIGFIMYRRQKMEAAIYSQWWWIKAEDIQIFKITSQLSFGSKRNGSMAISVRDPNVQKTGTYKGTRVHIKRPKLKTLIVDRALLLELKQMRDITSQNLTRLIGICPDANNVSIITEHCARGNLQEMLHSESIKLDWDFRISLINDIVEGMNYLHTSPINVHGRLTSSTCVIDSRFVLKITGFGLTNITAKIHRDENVYPLSLLWMAPEHLRVYPAKQSSQLGDVYSFGVILYEICTRNEPYVNEEWYSTLDDAIGRIIDSDNQTRPTFTDEELCEDIAALAKLCWSEAPSDRPPFHEIKRIIKSAKISRNMNPTENVLDVLLKRMEQYANNLETVVEERTRAFLDEKKKSEELLYQVLPKSVADQLRVGKTVSPEAFESVTIYFSDIVGFTAISALSSPFEIVDLLNDLYTCFDTIIENYDVYKVETIGDAYMVVSGLPVKNGNEHVRQIARTALNILASVRKFTIRHHPETPLQARIGMHSGPVCAGIVGTKMPRYCLFGDTVNMASRMESNGEAMKIQMSEQSKDLLELHGHFITEERGTINVKGKGLIKTFWLLDEQCIQEAFV